MLLELLIATAIHARVPTIAAQNNFTVADAMTTCIRNVGAFDVGRAINPGHVVGQIIGGEVMGTGYALTEGLVTVEGRICNNNFTDYRILRACDIPEIEAIIVESHEPSAAFGAKGVGEITNVGTASAIANAIYDAVGVRMTELPITQEKVLEALSSREKWKG